MLESSLKEKEIVILTFYRTKEEISLNKLKFSEENYKDINHYFIQSDVHIRQGKEFKANSTLKPFFNSNYKILNNKSDIALLDCESIAQSVTDQDLILYKEKWNLELNLYDLSLDLIEEIRRTYSKCNYQGWELNIDLKATEESKTPFQSNSKTQEQNRFSLLSLDAFFLQLYQPQHLEKVVSISLDCKEAIQKRFEERYNYSIEEKEDLVYDIIKLLCRFVTTKYQFTLPNPENITRFISNYGWVDLSIYDKYKEINYKRNKDCILYLDELIQQAFYELSYYFTL